VYARTKSPQTNTSRSDTPAHVAPVAPLVHLRPQVAAVPGQAHQRGYNGEREAAALLGDGNHRRVRPTGPCPRLAPEQGTLVKLPYGLRSHVPLRPLWICRNCGTPWPCAMARLMLKGKYWDRRADLPVFMAEVMHEAIVDLSRLNPSELDPADVFNRFIEWTQRRPERPAG
jgi:hypothetical protein